MANVLLVFPALLRYYPRTMNTDDLAKEYQTRTNEEILRLAKKPDRLTPEAAGYLMNEVARRGLQTSESPVFAGPSLSAGFSAAAAPALERSPAADENSSSSLRVETAKAPWRPKTAGRIAFWFGPIGGAMVVATSLRRMGHQQRAKRVMLLAYVVAAIEAAILSLVSDGVARLVGFVGEIGFLLFFPPFMEKKFKDWKGAHSDVEPSGGLNAIGLGLTGAVIFAAFVLIMAMLWAVVFPGRSQ